jgi:hypothetical protein
MGDNSKGFMNYQKLQILSRTKGNGAINKGLLELNLETKFGMCKFETKTVCFMYKITNLASVTFRHLSKRRSVDNGLF